MLRSTYASLRVERVQCRGSSVERKVARGASDKVDGRRVGVRGNQALRLEERHARDGAHADLAQHDRRKGARGRDRHDLVLRVRETERRALLHGSNDLAPATVAVSASERAHEGERAIGLGRTRWETATATRT